MRDAAETEATESRPSDAAVEPAAPEPSPEPSPSRSHPVTPTVYRGRIFKAVSLAPRAPLADWLDDLDAVLARSPALLQGRAVILDVAALAEEPASLPASLRAALDELRGRGIRIMGLEGGLDGGLDPEAARDPALPPRLLGGRPAPDLDLAVEPRTPPLSSVTIEGTVRSGQTVVNLAGDVTVTGSVSSGAEILAGGNIHVYGALRGRAIAGAARNPRARIYCRRFEPELLGIDRLVRSADEVGAALRGKPAQVWLDAGAMRTALLD